jgi:predicted ATPase
VRDDVRLLTLTGPAGTGKTRLGLHVAGELIHQFEDGVFFVALAPITEPELVAPTIAQTMGLRDAGARPALDNLKYYLRGKHVLLSRRGL